VMLHPFVRVPRELTWMAVPSYPDDGQILSVGQKCAWAEVYTQTGLNNCAKLNQILLASIGSIAEELIDFEAREVLQSFLESEPVWMPTEGRFEPMLQMDLLAAFDAASHTNLIFVPEFPELDEKGSQACATQKRRSAVSFSRDPDGRRWLVSLHCRLG
jgi:hypothetical protein